jgi:inner membrane protein
LSDSAFRRYDPPNQPDTPMPTIITHAVVPIAMALALGKKRIEPRLLALGVVAAMLPDADVLAFRLHIAYAHQLGHRGASHSLFFAFLLGVLGAVFAARLGLSRLKTLAFVALCAASHGLLDMLTNGGLGVALWWPWSNERHFFPCPVMEVSPLSLRRVFSPAGLSVFRSELIWVWVPALGMAFTARQLGPQIGPPK